MKRLYAFLFALVVTIIGVAFVNASNTNVITVTENEKVEYGSCTDGHTYKGDYTVIYVATCTDKGTKYRTCAICGYLDIVETEKNPDNHTQLDADEWVYFPEATCIESGVRYHLCKACNVHVDEEVVPENENSHKGSGQYIIITESTCSATGTQAEKCELCGELCNYSEIACNPSKHTVTQNSISEITVLPSCAVEGVAVAYCDFCGNVAVTTSVPATENHVPGEEIIVDVAPNCTNQGSCSKHCVICDTPMYVQPLEAEPDAHEYGDFVIDSAATCISEGEKSRYCIHCNERTDVTVIDVNIDAHSYGEEWVITKEATCAEMGLKNKVCTLCGCNSIPVVTEKTDHSYNDNYEILNISADKVSAQVKYVCIVCENEYITIIPYESDLVDFGDYTDDGYYRLKTTEKSTAIVDYNNLIVSNIPEGLTLKNFSTRFINSDDFTVYDSNYNAVTDLNIICTGYRMNHTAEDGKVTNYYISVKGDIDGDGQVTTADARLVLRAAASIDVLNNVCSVAANVNEDERVSVADARIILRVAVGLEKFSYGTVR